MELYVLDSYYDRIGIVDSAESFIWTDRFQGSGDFELVTKPSSSLLSLLQVGRYLYFKDSEHLMIVEDIKIKTDEINGNRLIFTGRSLEWILSRRIIWNQTVLTGDFQDGIKKLLDENAIAATITNRRFTDLIFVASTDPAITDLTINGQFFGDNLYDVVQKYCEEKKIGFKITLSTIGKFEFRLYNGVDRSYSQSVRPYVVFSPEFDNLIKSDYFYTKELFRTVTLVAGEGQGSDRLIEIVARNSGEKSNLERRELYTDASDISRTVGGVTIPESEYRDQLKARGRKELVKWKPIKSFEGQADTTVMYTYGTHFYMGDIIQIKDEYGHEGDARVTEVIYSEDASGVSVIPSFTTIED